MLIVILALASLFEYDHTLGILVQVIIYSTNTDIMYLCSICPST